MEDFLYQGKKDQKNKYTLDDLNGESNEDNTNGKGLWGAVANSAATGNTA